MTKKAPAKKAVKSKKRAPIVSRKKKRAAIVSRKRKAAKRR